MGCKMKKSNKDFYNKRGVTLISLIITIIVILILAGITVKMITGENGLISETISAREEAEIKKVEENLNESYKYLQEETNNAFEEAIRELKEEGYKIKIENDNSLNNKFYVLIGEEYYEIFTQGDEIKVERK